MFGILILVLIVLLVLFYYTSTFKFFEKKGVPFLKPVTFLGNLGPLLRATTSLHEIQLEMYDHFKGNPLGGTFEGRRPVLHVLDPDIIKYVTIRDFDHFTDRNLFGSRKRRYVSQSLLHLKGSAWKRIRNTVTPAFSSARLKNMFPIIDQCAHQMVEYLKKYVNKEAEMKQTIGHYTLEVIGACAFGIKCDALSNENAYFYKVAQKFDKTSKFKRFMLLMCLIFTPKLLNKYFNTSMVCFESADELVRMLQAAKAERKRFNTRENDFLQILIDVAEKEKTELGNNTSVKHLDDDTIDAQCLLFLVAGYETTSTLLSFAIHELAINPNLQDKLRDHITKVTNGKKICFELLSQLTYLDGFLLEILRLYPPVARVDRLCTKPYTIPNTSVRLDIGDTIAVPVYGIHMDPEYYPEPHKLRPERFMHDEKKERPSHLFLAFGYGPRNCIGMRFAMVSAKTVMVTLLKNYKFSTCSQTKYPIEFSKTSTFLKPKNGLWVRVESLY